MSILRWHSSKAPTFSSSSSSKREPSAYEVLDEHVGDPRPFYQIVNTPLAFPARKGGESKVGEIWSSLFPSLVQLITRMRWPGADTALERMHLKQEHDAVYEKQEGVGAIDTSAYWYLAKLMTAGDVKDVIQLALNKNRSWVRKELLPESLDSGDAQYYTNWYRGIPNSMVYSCCGQQIGPQTKGCWISLDPQNQADETVIPYTLMPSSTAENMWSRLADEEGLAQNLIEFLKTQPTLNKGTAFLDYNKFAALDREIQTAWFVKVLPLLAKAIRFYMQVMDASLQQEPPAPFPVNASQVLKVGGNAFDLVDLWSALKHVVALVYKFNEPQYYKDGCKQVMPMLESEWNTLFNSTILHVDISKKYFTVEKRGFIRFVNGGKEVRVTPLRSWTRAALAKLVLQLPAFQATATQILQYAELWNELNSERLQMSLVQVSNAEFSQQFNALASESTIIMRVNTALRAGQVKIDMREDNNAIVVLQQFYTNNLAAKVSVAALVEQAKGEQIETSALTELRVRLQQSEAQLASIKILSEQESGLSNAKGLVVQELKQLQQDGANVVRTFTPYIWINQTNKNLKAQESLLVDEQMVLFDTELQTLLTRARKVAVEVDGLNKLYQERLNEIEKQKQLAAERQRQAEETKRQRIVEVARRKKEEERLAEARRLQLEDEQRQQISSEQEWLQAEIARGDLVDRMIDFLLVLKEGNNKDTAQRSLEQLYASHLKIILVERISERDDIQRLAWILNLTNSNNTPIDRPMLEDAVWNNRIRRGAFGQAIVKFIRYMIKRDLEYDQEDFDVVWANALAAELSKMEPQKTTVNVQNVVAKLQQRKITPSTLKYDIGTANFAWKSEGGGSCAFDALMTGMFKVPGTWLERTISNATEARALFGFCNVDNFHKAVTQDVAFLQTNRVDHPFCLTRNAYYECIGKEPTIDDSREMLVHLAQFYKVENNMVVKPTQDRVIPAQIGIGSNATQIVMFEIVNARQALAANQRLPYTVPATLNNGQFTLLTCFIFKGGNHWLSYVRDPTKSVWWKFDAIANVNVSLGLQLPAGVLGLEMYEQPAAFVYVRTSSLLKNVQEDEEREEQRQELEEAERRAAAVVEAQRLLEIERVRLEKEKEAEAQTRRRAEEVEQQRQQLEEAKRQAAEESEVQRLLDIQRKKAEEEAARLKTPLPILERLISALENNDASQVEAILNETGLWPDNQCDLLAQAFQVSSNLPVEEYYRYISSLMEQSANDEMVRRLEVLFQTVQDERVLAVLDEIAQEK